MILDIPRKATGALVIRGRRQSYKKCGKGGLKRGPCVTPMSMDTIGRHAKSNENTTTSCGYRRPLYDQRQNMEPRVSDELLYENIEEHIQQSRHTLQNWLAVHESTIIQSIKQATKQAIQGVRSIKSYFSSGRPPDTPVTTPQPERNSTKHNDNKSKGVSPSEESPNLVSCGPLGVSGGSCG